jgi:hypothetical protein
MSLAPQVPPLFSTMTVDFSLQRLQNLSVAILVNILALRDKY